MSEVGMSSQYRWPSIQTWFWIHQLILLGSLEQVHQQFYCPLLTKFLTELGLLFQNSLKKHSLKLTLQEERMVFGSNTTTFCLMTEPAQLSKVTNDNFSFPIYKRTMTAVKCSRQSLVFHTFSLSFIMLCLLRHYDKKQAFLQNNNPHFLHPINVDMVENFRVSPD